MFSFIVERAAENEMIRVVRRPHSPLQLLDQFSGQHWEHQLFLTPQASPQTL